MELLSLIITSLVVALSFLLEPSSAHSLQHLDDAELPQYSLPRKLYFHQETMKYSSACEDCTPHKNLQQSLSPDRKQDEKGMKSAATEVVFEEEEEKGPKKSEYFTMDYGWVRRRRPIHNKQLPLNVP